MIDGFAGARPSRIGERETVRPENVIGADVIGERRGKEMGWGAHDCLFVPSWNWHHFENKSAKEPAIIFFVSDRPVLESLGLFREEAA